MTNQLSESELKPQILELFNALGQAEPQDFEEYAKQYTDHIMQLIEAYTASAVEQAVTHALRNLKSIEYPPSGKEYYFTDDSWTNSLTDAVATLSKAKEEA